MISCMFVCPVFISYRPIDPVRLANRALPLSLSFFAIVGARNELRIPREPAIAARKQQHIVFEGAQTPCLELAQT